MINKIDTIKPCYCCKNKANFKMQLNKKEFYFCKDCLNNLYSNIGKFIMPKSPESLLKRDNRIKNERF